VSEPFSLTTKRESYIVEWRKAKGGDWVFVSEELDADSARTIASNFRKGHSRILKRTTVITNEVVK
jgi:hypothetical protein